MLKVYDDVWLHTACGPRAGHPCFGNSIPSIQHYSALFLKIRDLQLTICVHIHWKYAKLTLTLVFYMINKDT